MAENKLYFIEANPNPILADDEDFALAAGKAGLPYQTHEHKGDFKEW